jgi:hypothetical protein
MTQWLCNDCGVGVCNDVDAGGCGVDGVGNGGDLVASSSLWSI